MGFDKEIKFVYFDIGGVLVDHIVALRKIAKDLKIEESEILALFGEYGDELDRGVLSWKDFEKILYERLDPPLKLKMSLAESFVDNFELIQETHDLINEIRNSFDIGILSNVANDVFDLIKSKNLIPNIDYRAVIWSAELKIIKPEKEIFDYALKQAAVLPSEVLFVDDSKVNVDAARLLGWGTVLFDTQDPSSSVKEIKNILQVEMV